jgi:hypothetical protein
MRLDETDFNDLERILRNWTSLTTEANYDFVGMFHLFRACVLNLMDHSTRDDWVSVQELLEPPEREFLRKVARGFDSGID